MADPRILLLQARHPSDPMGPHERCCFAERCGLPEEQIVPHDLATGPPRPAMLAQCDALMVGGAGDYYVSKGNLPSLASVLEFFGELAVNGTPTFASCFGFHCLVRVLGGEIIHDPANTEVGTFEITVTESACHDPLLAELPPSFWAQLGHKDRAARLPAGYVNLASSQRCPYQAFRVPNQPIWATQFHPELDRRTNLDRFEHYVAGYSAIMTEPALEEARAQFRESPETSYMPPRFLELVLG